MKPKYFFGGFLICFEFFEVFEYDLSRVVWLLFLSKEVHELCLAFNGPDTERVVKSIPLITFDFHLLAFDYDVVVLNAYAFTWGIRLGDWMLNAGSVLLLI